MDIATVLGLIVATVAIVYSVIAGGGAFSSFIDIPSVVCVFGGSTAAVLICFPLKQVLSFPKVYLKTIFNKQESIPDLIDLLVSLAETARREGLLALETKVKDVKNPFIALGVQLAVDGTRPELIEEIMANEMNAAAARHKDGKNLMDQLGKFGPAYGMIGTLIGLVIMLGNMSDPAAIGPGMAVALLTTLYGAMLANIVCGPTSEKLAILNKAEYQYQEIAIKGIISIQSGDNPRLIQQKLNTFLHPKQRRAAGKAA